MLRCAAAQSGTPAIRPARARSDVAASGAVGGRRLLSGEHVVVVDWAASFEREQCRVQCRVADLPAGQDAPAGDVLHQPRIGLVPGRQVGQPQLPASVGVGWDELDVTSIRHPIRAGHSLGTGPGGGAAAGCGVAAAAVSAALTSAAVGGAQNWKWMARARRARFTRRWLSSTSPK